MEDWQTIVTLLQSYLDQWTAFLSKAPVGVVLAAVLFPIVLGALSKRLIVVVVCILLTAMAGCAILAPANIGVTLASGIDSGQSDRCPVGRRRTKKGWGCPDRVG